MGSFFDWGAQRLLTKAEMHARIEKRRAALAKMGIGAGARVLLPAKNDAGFFISLLALWSLGASAVQIGTAYLCAPEATTSALHRAALAKPGRETVIADVFSGRPARGVVNRFTREQGPINPAHPSYPLATPALAPLRKAAEAKGSGDFSWFWSGQGAPPPTGIGAGQLTRKLAREAVALLASCPARA